MPNEVCFLCASDEGVFIDITTGTGKILRRQVETCLSAKVFDVPTLSHKVCHKCAYEIGQCSNFVQKFKECRKGNSPKVPQLSCSLCYEESKESPLFDLNKDNHVLNNGVAKIKDLFQENFENEQPLICLTCRYHLDILFDLKNICMGIAEKAKDFSDKNIDYSNFPKVKTSVVKRKTTALEANEEGVVYISSDSESDVSAMARGRGRRRKQKQKRSLQSKLRTCDECQNVVQSGSDMYRFYRSGLTVCKDCWITIDPNKYNMRKRSIKTNVPDTKLCTVILKDVLAHTSFKEQKLYKVEKDLHGNKVFIISDDSSEGEVKSQKSSTSRKNNTDGTLSSNTDTKKKQKLKRSGKSSTSESTDIDDRPLKKQKSSMESTSLEIDTEKSPIEPSTKPSTVDPAPSKKRPHTADSVPSSDSDIRSRALRSATITSATSDSDTDAEAKRNRKKLKSILQGIVVVKQSDATDDSISRENSPKRKKLKKLPNPVSISACTNDNNSDNDNDNKSLDLLSLMESAEANKFKNPSQAKSKTPAISNIPVSPKHDSSEEMEKSKDYTCTKCNTRFENKLTGMMHNLTHFKQVELKLIKVSHVNTECKEQNVDEVTTDQTDGVKAECDICIRVEDDIEKPEESPEAATSVTSAGEHISEVTNSTDKQVTVETVAPSGQSSAVHTDISDERTTIDINPSREHRDVETEPSDTCIVVEHNTSDECIFVQSNPIKPSSPCAKTVISEEFSDTKLDESKKPELITNDSIKEDSLNGEALAAPVESTVKLSLSVPVKDNHNDSTLLKSDSKHIQACQVEQHQETTEKDGIIEVITEKDGIIQETMEKEGIIEKVGTNVEQQDICEKLHSLKNGKGKDFTDTIDNLESDTLQSKINLEMDEERKDITERNEPIGTAEKDVESETDIKIVYTGSSEDSTELRNQVSEDKCIDVEDNDSDDIQLNLKDVPIDETEESDKVSRSTTPTQKDATEVLVENKTLDSKTKSSITILDTSTEGSLNNKDSNNDSTNTVIEVLHEVFALATAELNKRQKLDGQRKESTEQTNVETLEDISREISNSADMPSLDPISTRDLEDNTVTLH